jgi:hypothetical protein
MAAKKVVLYFDNHVDALHFTLAAGSVMAGDNRGRAMNQMVNEVARASRITVTGTLDPQNPAAADDTDVTASSECVTTPVSSSPN